ncbi:MAG: LCP family protein [Acidimicrobiia bacterium]
MTRTSSRENADTSTPAPGNNIPLDGDAKGGSLKKRILIGAGVVALVLIGAGTLFAVSTWGDVNRVAIDRPSTAVVEAASEPVGVPDSEAADVESVDDQVTIPPSADGLDVFLIVGSDSRAQLEDPEGFGSFSGQRADVVMVLLRPRDGSTAALLSLPRDLLVDSVCWNRETRINVALEGCGDDMNGPTALTLTVEQLTGVTVDHFAMVDLAGFIGAVDAIGGYEICVDNPVRDARALLELPAGCTNATGEQTLAWLRSRRTQELTDNGWRTMEGQSDLSRNVRQREFLVAMMAQLSDFSSPQDIASAARQVAPFLTIDASLSFMDAVGLAWTMRGLGSGSITEIEVPVRYATTDDGATVLASTLDIAELVAEFLSPPTAGDDGRSSG